MAESQNYGWRLVSRPHGKPVPENFRYDALPLPALNQGEYCYAPSFSHWILTCVAVWMMPNPTRHRLRSGM